MKCSVESELNHLDCHVSQSRVSPKNLGRAQPCCGALWDLSVLALALPSRTFVFFNVNLGSLLKITGPNPTLTFAPPPPPQNSGDACARGRTCPPIGVTFMGVESGGTGGRVPRSRKISGEHHPRNYHISASFFDTYENFAFSTIFKIKWPKSEEKLNFGGSGFGCP